MMLGERFILQVLIIALLIYAGECERNVAATDDICRRFQFYSGCPQAAKGKQPAQPQTQPTAPGATGAGAGPGAGPAPGSEEPAATPTPPPLPAGVPGAGAPPELTKACLSNANLAQDYCVGPPNELIFLKKKCDDWRMFCQDLFPATTPQPFGAAPCAPDEKHKVSAKHCHILMIISDRNEKWAILVQWCAFN